MSGLTDRYGKQIAGTIKCLDRVVITGTLPTACYANGMTGCLYAKQIRIFDYFDFIKPLKDGIHENAKRIGQSRRPRNARSRRDRHYRKL